MMIKAYFVGITIALAAHVIWFVVIYAELNADGIRLFDQIGFAGLRVIIWGSLVVAGFTSAWLAPRGKLLTGTLLAVPASMFLGVSNFLLEASGTPVDFHGANGAMILVGVSLPFDAALCGLGSLFGYLLRRGSEPA
jgi:hypothetical protein